MSTPNPRPFTANKMIVIARNPIDVFPSFIGLTQLESHSLVPEQQVHSEFPDWWNEWVTKMAQNLKESHKRTMD